MDPWWRGLFRAPVPRAGYQYSRRMKVGVTLMGATALGVTVAAEVAAGAGWLLLAERTPKALLDWIALLFIGACILGMLFGVVMVAVILYRALKLPTT